MSAGMLLALAISLLGQDPEAVVQESELPPAGHTEAGEPPPSETSDIAPPPADAAQEPPLEDAPEPAEAPDLRRTNERPTPGRNVAAFWFVN